MSNFKNVLGIVKAVIGVGAVMTVGYKLGKTVEKRIVKKIAIRKQRKAELKQIEETEV